MKHNILRKINLRSRKDINFRVQPKLPVLFGQNDHLLLLSFHLYMPFFTDVIIYVSKKLIIKFPTIQVNIQYNFLYQLA